MNKNLKIGILGCGSIGRRHTKNLLALGYTNILCFDPDPQARFWIKKNLSVDVVEREEQFWRSQHDVILINSPPKYHLEHLQQALVTHAHVFVEKPLGCARDGFGELAGELNRQGLVHMVGCNMRFHPGPKKIKSLLKENAIGKIIAARLQFSSYLPRWRPWQDYTFSYTADPDQGGAILDCIHEIDLAMWFFGKAQLLYSVYRKGKSIKVDTDGLAELLLLHESDVLSNIHLSFVQRDYYRVCQIIGEKGTIFWDFNENLVKLFAESGKEQVRYLPPRDWQLNQMYVDEMAYFLEKVERKEPTQNPVDSGLAALEIALDAREKGRLV